MPTWAWVLVVVGALLLGGALGFGFAAWLIGMNQREGRPPTGGPRGYDVPTDPRRP